MIYWKIKNRVYRDKSGRGKGYVNGVVVLILLWNKGGIELVVCG